MQLANVLLLKHSKISKETVICLEFLCSNIASKDVDIENGLEDMGGRGKLGQRESSIDIHTLPNVK